MRNTTNIFTEIANKINTKIKNGSYSIEQKLPSEYDLAKEFNVSRLTIRKAVDLLIKQNILIKQKGKGTYIMKQTDKFQSGKNGLLSFTESARAYGKTSKATLITFEKTTQLPEEVKENLQVQEEPVFHIKRLRFFDEDPMTIEEIFIKETLLDEATLEENITGSIFKLIEEKSDIAYSHQEIEAVLATDELSEFLAVEKGQPLLLVHTTTYSASGHPILFDKSYYRGDKYTFKNILHRI
ncbi:GntR family transcriptional regulator, LSA1692 subfamily [Vagococcus hydrophili]|uniref:GntR family transcriptional regulator n=1 Tax=Vagococcus hydrophili TaxID=2714947 RepID=A0A6G8AQM9_9ENTE|nr:GntR family transcriptional regulator, LSA1692 subfamily [Vagococcus hydrophili]QIL47297.1 GntR family transcriptional regulator [Vagococcus hydrophili]